MQTEIAPCCLNCAFAMSAQRILGYRGIDAMSCEKQPHRCQPIRWQCNIGKFQAATESERAKRYAVLKKFEGKNHDT